MEAQLGELSAALEAATQSAAQVPGRTDLDFYCSIDAGLQQSLARVREQLQATMVSMHAWLNDETHADNDELITSMTMPASFSSAIGDQVDQLLERADIYMDEFVGRRNVHETAKPDPAPSDALPASGPLPPHILNAQIPKPQRLFTTQPDNRAEQVWKRPLRFGKPHALVPQGYVDPAWNVRPDAVIAGMYGTEADARLNPYHVEIHRTPVPKAAFAEPVPVQPAPLDVSDPSKSTKACTFQWVDSADKLNTLLSHLQEPRVQEIAVDLEHHSKHSYLGLVSLMQISTRWGDWIVDTLVDDIRENAEQLNAVFTDPAKILVLHGADHDILWLQRDLGVYVTNLFDTYHATNVLNFSVHSLAYLLARYIEFDADKRFQLADWRIRPLPREMLFYARSDTHSLLYVYDRLRQELLAQGGEQAIAEVFVRSRATASKAYAKEPWDEDGNARGGWRTLWLRHGGDLALASPEKKAIEAMGKEERLARRLHRWRDQVARAEDEGAQYILSASNLLHIVFRMPCTAEEVKRTVPPTAQAVRARSAELAKVIQDEVRAWEDATRRRQDQGAAQLDELVQEEADDCGEAVVMPTPATGRVQGHQGAQIQAQLWETRPVQAEHHAPQLFNGMLTADPHGRISEAHVRASAPKRTSLFETPAYMQASVGTSSTLARIRGECVGMLERLVGGRAEDGGRVEEGQMGANVGAGFEASERTSTGADLEANERANVGAYTQTSTNTAPPTPDPIVQVSKKRWSKDKKRKCKEPTELTPSLEPFDYSNATSVLETARREEGLGLLGTQDASKRKSKHQDTKKSKSAKRKSDVRSGNRGKTFV
ncbi:exosome nuclease subunit [Malassezia vespertilionis]|uniref:Rrp6p n=1 Tax=Malassezia vespertilionis TaxID=2020962 RepID=A0A2N1J797_9BASI|nr:exosome nuclease subunit [Malassezia vespertilionis]PKI82342.1 Rrp6p [Malassezia vespertilionis]WFD08113.1 exosome nuclease subunit [Malassezia vespertilionis]